MPQRLINTTLVKLGNQKPKYYIHPFKDLRCSRTCYLNWANHGQNLPSFHTCKCDSFKYI